MNNEQWLNQVTLWDTEAYMNVRTLEGHTSYVWGVAWSPEGDVLAAGNGMYEAETVSGNVMIWTVPSGHG
jgi:WD40 repeat protein